MVKLVIYFNLYKNCFYCSRPAHRSAQAGVQAGPVAEAAGLRTGPNRGAGRGQARGCRPSGRPRPGWRPGLYQSQPACWPAQADAPAGRACGDTGEKRPAATISWRRLADPRGCKRVPVGQHTSVRGWTEGRRCATMA